MIILILLALLGILGAVIAAIKSTSAAMRVSTILLAVFLTWFCLLFHSAMTLHGFHGDMNSGVGFPYTQLIGHFKSLADQGRYDELKAKLTEADSHSQYIYSVWLYPDSANYRQFTTNLIQTNIFQASLMGAIVQTNPLQR